MPNTQGQDAPSFFLDSVQDSVGFHKKVNQIVGDLASTGNINKISGYMDENLVTYEAQFCPPIPPTDYNEDGDDDDEEEENLELGDSCFHCLLTLRRHGNEPGCLQSCPDVPLSPGMKLLLAKRYSLAVHDKAIFVVPKIFSGWYNVAHAVEGDDQLLQIPMTLQMGPGGKLDGEYWLSERMRYLDSFDIKSLKLAHVWKYYQTRPASDGVAILDGAMPFALVSSAISLTGNLIEEKQATAAPRCILVDPEMHCYKHNDPVAGAISELPCSFPGVAPVQHDSEIVKSTRNDTAFTQIRILRK